MRILLSVLYLVLTLNLVSASRPALSQERVPSTLQLPPGITTARQGTFMQQVKLVGQVEAVRQTYLAPVFSAKLEMLAEEGAQVKKGDVVARLEIKNREERLEENELELETALSDFNEHNRNTAAQKVRLQAEVQRAQAVVNEKQLALQLLEAGTRSEELQKKQLAFDLANQAYDLAHSTLQLKERLAQKGMSTRLEVLQARLEVANKQRDLELASAELKKAQRGPTALTLQGARIELQSARESLNWAQASQRLELRKAELERQKKAAKRDSLKAEVKELRSEIRAAEIKAPMDGTVVLNKTWTQTGLKRVGVGDEVHEGNPFMSVADLSEVVLRTEIEESLLRDLSLGLEASIRLPSMQGQRFVGKVSKIGVFAHERSGRKSNQGLSKVFDLSIAPVQQDSIYQPGTSVDIELPLRQQQDVLMLPREAIYRNYSQQGDAHYVILENDERRIVQLGEANAKDVVVLSGLQLSDRVKLPEDVQHREGKDASASTTSSGSVKP